VGKDYPPLWRSIAFALRVCFGTEVRFFLTTAYVIIAMTWLGL
jgi:hypothetical protein